MWPGGIEVELIERRCFIFKPFAQDCQSNKIKNGENIE
jgi:hypothetical protein